MALGSLFCSHASRRIKRANRSRTLPIAAAQFRLGPPRHHYYYVVPYIHIHKTTPQHLLQEPESFYRGVICWPINNFNERDFCYLCLNVCHISGELGDNWELVPPLNILSCVCVHMHDLGIVTNLWTSRIKKGNFHACPGAWFERRWLIFAICICISSYL